MSNQYSIFDECFVDSFAGGGGASTGIELATGHPIDVAINHDEAAIMMHRRNHPFTEHYREDVWQVDPKTAVRGRHVRLAWFSPDCKHFSRAKLLPNHFGTYDAPDALPHNGSLTALKALLGKDSERVLPDVIGQIVHFY